MRTQTIWYLELCDPSWFLPGKAVDEPPSLEEMQVPDWRFNKYLYEWVGKDWNWKDKLSWTDDEWKQYINRAELRTFLAKADDDIAGYFELEFQPGKVMQISYFGLTPAFIGKGFGSWLLEQAVLISWLRGAGRIWVHTCNEDHPAALPNYKNRGFRLFREEEVTLE
jgi:ribosomal protein S18 acetylase RimI-like enzyme